MSLSNINLNQKVTPETKENYDKIMDLYLQSGRITRKGEIFELIYLDHMELERKRLFLESCSDVSKELFLTLERVQELLLRENEYFQSQMERLKKEQQDQIHWRDKKIEELENSIQQYKGDLEEKILENATIRKGLEQFKRKIEGTHNTKSVG